MNHTTRSARTSFLRTDFFAALRGVFGGGSGSGAGFLGRNSLLKLSGLLTLTITALLALCVTSAPALAARPYQSQLTEANGTALASPMGLTVDSSDNLWVTEATGGGTVDKFNASGTYEAQTASPPWSGTYIESAAFSAAAGEVFVSDSNADDLWGLEPSAAYSGADLNSGLGGGTSFIRVAADNSGGATDGDLYVSKESPQQSVVRIDGSGAAANFSSAEPYVSGNELTGPFSFAGPLALAVDSNGNLYVAGNKVYIFEPSGTEIGEITEFEGSPLGPISAIAVDSSSENILLTASGAIEEFSSSGESLAKITAANGGAFSNIQGLAVDSAGTLYAADRGAGVVDVFGPAPILPKIIPGAVTNPTPTSATVNANVDPHGGGNVTKCEVEYGVSTAYGLGSIPCSPDPAASPPASNFSVPTPVHADLSGLTAETTYHYRFVATGSNGTQKGPDRTYTPRAVASLSTDPATEVANVSVTLNGSYTGENHDTHYYFEYGTGVNYGHLTAVADAGPALGHQSLTAEVAGLASGTTYHYRVVAENEFGVTVASNEQTFTTAQPPTINASSTSNVTATSADLHAEVDPHGFATTYRFEYGTTSSYGQSIPVPDGEIGEELGTAHSVEAHLSGLQGVQYHFRIVAENQWGTVASEDQTFEFFPPGCPNSAVRQQTGSAYLPDCRAYELVSPGNANGTLLYSGGPNTGTATAPSRFSFTGNANSLKGTKTIETAADLYTATRTDSGWESKYIGLPGDEAGCMGGPPNSPTSHVIFNSPPYLTNTVLADTSMGRLLIWLDGTPLNCFAGRSPFYDNNWEKASPSNAPYMFNADGSLNQRLPSSFPGGEEAVEALKCPYPNADYVTPPCTGDVTASADLSHFVFSSNKASFAEGGVVGAPGSAYDNDIATNTVSLISLDSAGDPIAQDPNFANVPPEPVNFGMALGGKEEFIRFPAISSDGSHILMSTATARTHPCTRGQSEPEPCERFTDTPIHLYMRVNDAISYEPSRGEDGENHAVKYIGMTPDGSKVFFTSEEQLIAADKDTSTDLYMWSEATDSLTLVSKAANAGNAGEAGQSDSCSASWTTQCGIQPNENYEWSLLPGGEGGNNIADSAITPGGDIYFYSPEQLDGDKGVLGGQNLYGYREGKAQFVATLEPEKKCRPASPQSAILCAEGPILRFEATPDDSRAAFLTTTQLTSYDNAGQIEMYSFTPSSGEIVCDSCRPDGKAPTDDVKASQDGRFISNDGRVFFSTADPLVAQDTNEGIDVYEYVDGRPQLITPGTGTATPAGGPINISGFAEKPGLVAVSNDGTDVYFDTFDILTAEDHNGNFLKFYDARVNGGFAQPTPVPPCAAAEECHGAGSSAPVQPTQGTAAGISGGNAKHKPAARHKAKKHHKKAAKRHRARAAKSKGRAGK